MLLKFATICFFSAATLYAQTACSREHANTGVFLCFPDPALKASERNLPDIFHISAQANAEPGRLIRRYTVLIDKKPVYQIRLTMPSSTLSIETNVRSPYSSGTHTLSLSVENAGTVEIAGVRFHPASHLGFCDTFSRVDPRACVPLRNSTPLRWSLPAFPRTKDVAAALSDFLGLYSRNLARVEADIADAVAVDDAGNLFTATHSPSDIEIRKYLPDGSIAYDHLVRLCSRGFVSIAAIQVAGNGRLWLAGNSTACLPITAEAATPQISPSAAPHGFLLSVDPTKTDAASLVFSTWLAPVPSQIAAMRIDGAGNIYVAGNTVSSDFPHNRTVALPGAALGSSSGFLAILSTSGSPLISSTLLPGTQISALATDGSQHIYLAGTLNRGPAFIAGLHGTEQQLSYFTRLGTGNRIMWRAISSLQDSSRSRLLLLGQGANPFLLALEPCKIDRHVSRLLPPSVWENVPAVALQPALDAFAASLPEWRFPERAPSRIKFEIVQRPSCNGAQP